jgi:hypothetical protein
MRRSCVVAAVMLLVGATSAHAHRLDEYLQATTISVGKDRVSAQLRLTPGVAVFPTVLAAIDGNSDGVISAAEQRSYVERVLRDLSLTVDGDRLTLRLVASKFASIQEMKEGRGDIVIDFAAVMPGGGSDRTLKFENRHMRATSVFLVNALVPHDPDIRVTHQNRDYTQSSYQMDYAQADAHAGAPSFAGRFSVPAWIGLVALLSLALLRRRRDTAERALAEREGVR